MTAAEHARARRRYDSPVRRQRAAETRERIVAAGAAILHDHAVWNFDTLTVRGVAERAGVNERTVYRHFANERDAARRGDGAPRGRSRRRPRAASRSRTSAISPRRSSSTHRRSRSSRARRATRRSSRRISASGRRSSPRSARATTDDWTDGERVDRGGHARRVVERRRRTSGSSPIGISTPTTPSAAPPGSSVWSRTPSATVGARRPDAERRSTTLDRGELDVQRVRGRGGPTSARSRTGGRPPGRGAPPTAGCPACGRGCARC